jgi:isoleucyl-tRNA synthetase
MLPFTTEEAWLERHPDSLSVHLEQFPQIPPNWRNPALERKWRKVKDVRRVVTGAMEIARAGKLIGASLEAVPIVHLSDSSLQADISGVDLAEIAIASDLVITGDTPPADAFGTPDVPGVAVVVEKAEARGLNKCARSWRYTADVGYDPDFPDVSKRDAEVLAELRRLGRI